MATTYEKIASVTVGSGGAADIEFTSIPQTFDDLVIKWSARASGGDQFGNILFNGSSSNFSSRRLDGDGSSASSASRSDNLIPVASQSTQTANTFASSEIYIPNYSGSTNKSFSIDFVNENNATFAYATMWAILWSNTSAITSIKITGGDPVFVQHSTAVLYGIKKS